MKKVLNKIMWGILMVSCSGIAMANSEELVKYQNAKIAVTYQGSVGEFAQRLAEKLKVGYYAAEHNSSARVKLAQDQSKTLQQLLDQANTQLSDQQLRFDLLDDKVVLALIGNDASIVPTQFIGDVIYADNAQPSINEEEEKTVEEIATILPPPVNAVSDTEAKKLEHILSLSKDAKLLAQYSKRKSPIYIAQGKEEMGLESIRSTKISTFLIFKDNIDMSQYQVEGEFQDMAKLSNVVAILHRQKRPPQEITVTAPSQKQYKLVKSN